MPVGAILWDYDGTLADSSKKNIEVTIEILRRFIPDVDENVPEALASRTSGRLRQNVRLEGALPHLLRS